MKNAEKLDTVHTHTHTRQFNRKNNKLSNVFLNKR